MAATREVILSFGAIVDGYYVVHALGELAGECLRGAACMAMVLPLGASLTLTAPKDTDDEDVIRWTVDITPAVREACRCLLLAERTELLATIVRRRAA